MGRKFGHFGQSQDARDAFLAELRRCGDARLACQRAGVSKSWAYEERRRRPRFARRWTEALDTYLRNAPERARLQRHLLEPFNPEYWSDTMLAQAFARMQRQRQKRTVSRASRRGFDPFETYDPDC